MARLDQICSLNMGQSPDSSSYNENGEGMPFFQGNADFGKVHPSVRVWCSAPTKVAHAGDVLISARAPIGALNIADRECCIGRGLAASTVNEELCNKDYLWYAIASKVDELNSKGTGSTFKAISKNVLAETEIPLPPLTEQQGVAGQLAKVDELITLRKEQLAKLHQLVKSRFIELFGDPVSNPHGYPKVPLSELAEIKIGPFGSLLHKEDYITNGHALVNPSHIVAGKISADDELTVSDEKFNELSAYHLQVGDVVMGRRGEMGRCAVVLTDGLLCGTGSLLIRTKGDVTADYLQKIISFPSFKKTIEDMAVGQTMPNLNVPIVSKFQIIKPPIEVQEAYYTFVEQTDISKLAIQQSQF